MFFAIIGVMLATAGVLDIYSESVCAAHDYGYYSGALILFSFVPNMMWVYSRHGKNRTRQPRDKGESSSTRFSMLLWQLSLLAGVYLSGSRFALACDDTRAFSWASMVLLILSIATPHVAKLKSD